ncbi:MAG: hypothetical protein PHC62_00355 [Candidatus Izemoplasmatales bacterium]|nr:hypothetical protein [Candidatus Izemoplasmatales bacterium]
MSMGYDNNSRGINKSEVRDPYVYSDFKLRNPQSQVDPVALNVQFMYGLLSINISPKKEDNTGDYINYDYEKKISIWLSYTHALILSQEMRRLIEVGNPSILKMVGVATKDDTLINFGYGTDYGTENFVLVIMKLNTDGGVQQSYCYEFPSDRYASIVNFDPSTKKYEKNVLPNIEVNGLLDVLETYSKSIHGAYAYANQYYNRFTDDAQYKMMSAVAAKLGVQNKSNYAKREGGFFNGGQQSGGGAALNGGTAGSSDKFQNRSLDDIEDEQYE